MDYYFIRHGESTLNREHTLQGWYNAPLSPRGHQQAAKLRGVLPPYPVVSSDLERAIETARELAEVGQRIQPDARLREADVGEWAGIPKVLVQESTLWRRYQTAPELFRFPGGESLEEVQKRMIGALEEYASVYPRLVIVSHQLALKSLICHLQGWDLASLHQFTLPNASVTHVTGGKGHWVCTGMGFDLQKA